MNVPVRNPAYPPTVSFVTSSTKLITMKPAYGSIESMR
eukprot:CAMPEP_0202470496 /NCGR_PEP_ID=MMETSP1360-20130828/81773_1 /ASSEMBLY_ACC=CAM_ASM_000848 /TAXON_ID=515479 /ORGANISM="Licmophora paradoxa, Strain CCMP2313" /LENGTH=37 /DNA_ID= /DNA_START= /DNA_END= /DNA_ORIENTATION=